VQRLGDQVAPQEAPRGPVVGGGDDVVGGAEERAGRGARAVRHLDAGGADQCGVREVPVGDEDVEARADPERDHWAVPLEQTQQEGLHVGRRVAQPQQVAEQWQRRRAGRKAPALGAAAK
jgi:hypothetical protein